MGEFSVAAMHNSINGFDETVSNWNFTYWIEIGLSSLVGWGGLEISDYSVIAESGCLSRTTLPFQSTGVRAGGSRWRVFLGCQKAHNRSSVFNLALGGKYCVWRLFFTCRRNGVCVSVSVSDACDVIYYNLTLVSLSCVASAFAVAIFYFNVEVGL